MDRQVFNTSLAPDCFVGEIGGDLLVKGWNLPQISVEAASGSLQIREDQDELHVNCTGDCEIRLPQATALEIETVRGDARIKLLDEHLKIGSVYGSLNLRETAGLQADTVYGNFSARNNTGSLTIRQVLGDVDLRRLEGEGRFSSILGDAALIGTCGDLFLQANGDVRINLSSLRGVEYSIQANGDLLCVLPVSSGLNLNLSSQAKSIKIQLPNINENLNEEVYSHLFGNGEIKLTIQAGGDIRLSAQEAPWEPEIPFMVDYGEQIASQVKSQIGQQMEEVSQRFKDQMELLSKDLSRVGMSPEDAERIVDQAMRLSERETTRAEEKMRRAQEKLERKLEEAQRKTEQKARSAERGSWTHDRRSWGRIWPAPPPPPPPASEPPGTSDEERMLILRMLEQKKITIDEAEKLLQALEGKS